MFTKDTNLNSQQEYQETSSLGSCSASGSSNRMPETQEQQQHLNTIGMNNKAIIDNQEKMIQSLDAIFDRLFGYSMLNNEEAGPNSPNPPSVAVGIVGSLKQQQDQIENQHCQIYRFIATLQTL